VEFCRQCLPGLFTEVGLGGLLAWMLLVGGIIVLLLLRKTREGRLVALCCAVYLVVGFASEGILYQPDAAFFWLYVCVWLAFTPGRFGMTPMGNPTLRLLALAKFKRSRFWFRLWLRRLSHSSLA